MQTPHCAGLARNSHHHAGLLRRTPALGAASATVRARHDPSVHPCVLLSQSESAGDRDSAPGLSTTATIMWGHCDGPQHWAQHLRLLRELQGRTRGITEFVPLPFVHMQAPIFLKGEFVPLPFVHMPGPRLPERRPHRGLM